MMDLLRNLLIAGLVVISYSLWLAWEKEHPTTPAANTQQIAVSTSNLPPLPSVPTIAEQTPQPTKAVGQLVQVKTAELNVTIDTLGGTIHSVSLPAYPADLGSKAPFTLLTADPKSRYIAQSDILSPSSPQTLLYHVAATDYQLQANQQQLKVQMEANPAPGVTITKIFTFNRGKYLINVDYAIKNTSQHPWQGYLYAQLERKKVTPKEHGFFHINPFIGAAYSTPEQRYNKLSFETLAEKNLDKVIQDGWIAMQEHYFLSAWVPPSHQDFHYSTQALGNDTFVIRMLSPAFTVPAGGQFNSGFNLYTGPATAEHLKTVAPGLDLAIDYGVLWIIGTAIFWLMSHIHQVVGNWGWSIVLVTVMIKLLFYRLSASSYRSMAAMRELQPKLQALKERYGDDRQKFSQATMELYRKEKINPLGGCLPMIVQIPVFIALYWVLLESVELRQAPFMLWIKDLALPDPYFVLPIIMGISMLIQQRLSPPPADPLQAKMMMFLPLIFTVFFLSFPAGLVLYWVVNNTLSILQQWYITQHYTSSKLKKRKS